MLNGHIKNVGDGFAFVVNFESLTVVAMAFALIALDVDIGEEVHFDFFSALPHACFAAAAFDVEGEAAGLVATDFCFFGF